MPVLLLILEVLFAACLVAGVGFIFWPAAMMLAGILGIWACERRAARPVASVRPIRRGEAA